MPDEKEVVVKPESKLSKVKKNTYVVRLDDDIKMVTTFAPDKLSTAENPLPDVALNVLYNERVLDDDGIALAGYATKPLRNILDDDGVPMLDSNGNPIMIPCMDVAIIYADNDADARKMVGLPDMTVIPEALVAEEK